VKSTPEVVDFDASGLIGGIINNGQKQTTGKEFDFTKVRQLMPSFFFFFFFYWVSDPLCFSSSSALHFFQLLFLGPPPLLTGMTGISLHIQWPLTPSFFVHIYTYVHL
jgi:hypothetical protein